MFSIYPKVEEKLIFSIYICLYNRFNEYSSKQTIEYETL